MTLRRPSQLATLTSGRVDSLYDLMDSAYDTTEIRAFSEKLGHVAIIDVNPRRRAEMKAERSGRRWRSAVSVTCLLRRGATANAPTWSGSTDGSRRSLADAT